MAAFPKRFDVFLIPLDPTQGAEMQKTRPCVVISPDEQNSQIRMIIIAPMTTKGRDDYLMRVPCLFQDKRGQIALDQLRAIDRGRILKRLGRLDDETAARVCETLQELFAY